MHKTPRSPICISFNTLDIGGKKSILLLLYLLMEKATKEPNLLRSVTQMHSSKNGEAMK